jgi:hypothetical protein
MAAGDRNPATSDNKRRHGGGLEERNQGNETNMVLFERDPENRQDVSQAIGKER